MARKGSSDSSASSQEDDDLNQAQEHLKNSVSLRIDIIAAVKFRENELPALPVSASETQV
jgi:hypothetical protein